MSKEFDNTNTGALFKVDDKQSDRHPDYNGSLNVDGVEYWVSGWIRMSKADKRYLSLSVKPKEKEEKPAKRPSQDGAKARQLDDESDIPF